MMLLIIGIIVYLLASLVTGIALLTDKEDIEWQIVLGLIVAWPIAVPTAAGVKIYDNIRETHLERRRVRRAKTLCCIRVMHKLDLVSRSTFSQILRGPD